MLIELEVNGAVYYSRNITGYAKDSHQEATMMHMRAFGRNKCRKKFWAIFIRRRSKGNSISKKIEINDRRLIK